jgi:hypothetical protein
MIRRALVVLCATLLLLSLSCASADAAGLRSVGVRFALPLGDFPALFGIEASTEFASGIGSATLYLSASGGSLLAACFDVPLRDGGATYVRMTPGVSYFDRQRSLPTPLVGVGLAVTPVTVGAVAFGFAGELLYPVAFPFPMLSLAGAVILR